MNEPEPLEDNWRDLVTKAAKGKALRELLKTLPPAGTEPSDELLRALAPQLGLQSERLIALARHPFRVPPALPEGVLFQQDSIPGETVRRSLIWDPSSGQAALFDTGFSAQSVLAELEARDLRLTDVFLTHAHHDHVQALPELLWALKRPLVVHLGEGEPGVPEARRFEPGTVFQLGRLSVETRGTPGHSPGGVTYVVSGLEKPVAVVGDAFFAGSVGYPPAAWDYALEAIRRHILSLPPETILLPGHGPATTVGEELASHPLFGWS